MIAHVTLGPASDLVPFCFGGDSDSDTGTSRVTHCQAGQSEALRTQRVDRALDSDLPAGHGSEEL
eukprot:696586-Rhodomonas_salina.1